MKFFLQILFIVRNEVGYLLLHPKQLLNAAVLLFVPAMYCVLYIASVWDPDARTKALSVALVNLDAGVKYRDHSFNVGWEITTRLEDSGRFGFVLIGDEPKARALVRDGKMAFAVIIPADFSARAVPGAEAGAGKVVVYASQGNNFETAAIAKHFAETLGSQINENLNERRWDLVLHNLAGSQHHTEHLREALNKLRVSAQDLSTRSAQTALGVQSLVGGARGLNEGIGQIASGMKQLGSTLSAMNTKMPSNADLKLLTDREKALANGQAELDRAINELQKGAVRLRERMAELRAMTKDSQFVAGNDLENLSKFSGEIDQLDTDLQVARTAQALLVARAGRLRNSVNSIVGGVRTVTDGNQGALARFPKDGQFDELGKGANDVAASTVNLVNTTQKTSKSVDHLLRDIDLLISTLPTKVDDLEGSAEGLANSVEPVVEIDAPVENSGSGFASNVIPGAIWLGAAVAAFLIHVQVLPVHSRYFSRPAQVIGKIFLPACVALLQSVIVFVAVLFVLKIHVLMPWVLALTLALSSLSFLLIVFALNKAFGDVGKGLAMVLLAVQLTASGGILPVELSGGLFVQISPWLPLTWVVESIKASMFGAYGGAWQPPLLLVGLAGLTGFGLSCAFGNWRFVKSTAKTMRSRQP
jgi:putative membrane protein